MNPVAMLRCRDFFYHITETQCPGGGIGRHAGLKILWPVMAVRVQVPPGVQNQSEKQSYSEVLNSDFFLRLFQC